MLCLAYTLELFGPLALTAPPGLWNLVHSWHHHH